MSVVNVYSVGPICCSACAPGQLSSDEVAREVNGTHPTGISSQWRVSGNELFCRRRAHQPLRVRAEPRAQALASGMLMTPSLYTFYIACAMAQLEAFLAEEAS